MFQSITIKSKESGELNLDPGFIAECLLFYQEVNLLADRTNFPDIINIFGATAIKELVESKRLRIFITEEHFGVPEVDLGGNTFYGINSFTAHRTSHENTIKEGLEQYLGNTLFDKKLINDFVSITEPYLYPKETKDNIINSLKDSEFFTKSATTIINYWNPDKLINPSDVEISFTEIESPMPFKLYNLETNIDLAKYKNSSKSGILLDITNSLSNLSIIGHFNSEIADRQLYASLIQDKINSLINKYKKSQEEINSFQDIVLYKRKRIGQAIINKQLSPTEFLKLLDKSDKFKQWLADAPEDGKIVAEYLEAIQKESILDKLPEKTAKFTLLKIAGLLLDLKGAGGLATLAANAIEVGDTFFLDKIANGWRPNQFIDDELKPMLPKQE
jgi:hypothetical protein